MKAKHYTSTHRPGFVWVLTIQLASWFWVSGWEAYIKHAANMFFKLYSALKVVVSPSSGWRVSSFSCLHNLFALQCTGLRPSRMRAARRWTSRSWRDLSPMPRSIRQHCCQAAFCDGGPWTNAQRSRPSWTGAHTAVAEFTFNDVGEIVKVHTRDERRVIVEGAHYSEDPWTGAMGAQTRLGSGVGRSRLVHQEEAAV